MRAEQLALPVFDQVPDVRETELRRETQDALLSMQSETGLNCDVFLVFGSGTRFLVSDLIPGAGDAFYYRVVPAKALKKDPGVSICLETFHVSGFETRLG